MALVLLVCTSPKCRWSWVCCAISAWNKAVACVVAGWYFVNYEFHLWYFVNYEFHLWFWHTWKKSDLKEQCVYIRFLFTIGKKCYEIFLNIANNFWRAHIVKNTSSWMVFPSPKMVWPLLKLPNAEDSHYSKIDENVDKVKQLVLKTRRLILHEVDNMLGIRFFSIQSSFKENLNMYWIATQCVSHSVGSKRIVSACGRTFGRCLK
jgi:hypothetical protein